MIIFSYLPGEGHPRPGHDHRHDPDQRHAARGRHHGAGGHGRAHRHADTLAAHAAAHEGAQGQGEEAVLPVSQ